jgi:hypothetical protein
MPWPFAVFVEVWKRLGPPQKAPGRTLEESGPVLFAESD